MKKRTLEDKEFYGKLKSLMLPIAFQSFMLAAVSAGDSAMLGFVDQNAMAAVSLAGNIQFVENLFLGALVCGATILTAQYWGKGDGGTVERVFGLILRYAFVISAVFCAIALVMPTQLMTIFTNEPELIAIGADYIRIASGSYLLTGITQCYLCIMKTTGQTKESAAISSFALGLDTVLNAIFIFGFSMGAKGAALTTTISRFVELLIVLYFSRKMAVRANVKTKVSSELHKDFLKCSIPHFDQFHGLGTWYYHVFCNYRSSWNCDYCSKFSSDNRSPFSDCCMSWTWKWWRNYAGKCFGLWRYGKRKEIRNQTQSSFHFVRRILCSFSTYFRSGYFLFYDIVRCSPL